MKSVRIDVAKKALLFLLLALLSLSGFAQKPKARKPAKAPKKSAALAKAQPIAVTLDLSLLADGQPVAFDSTSGILVSTDAVNLNDEKQKRYFDRYALTLRQGDLLLVEYASENFRVMLGLEYPKDASGKTAFAYDSLKFDILSKTLFQFNVPATGVYTLLLTSAEPQKIGAYKVRKFLLPPKLVTPVAGADFCQKLTFLMAQGLLDFNRLQGKKTKTDKKTGLVETYQSTYQVVAGQSTDIVRDYDLGKTKFNATLAEFNKKEEALKALETYAAQLRACTPGWQYETLEGDTFKEISAATYADFLSVSMRILGRRKFSVVLGVD